MCTLTYIPNPEGYTLTHNRDERTNRPSSRDFRQEADEKQRLYFPQDLEAKGTWMGYSNRGISACILNGGTSPYTRHPPYRHSRGLVVLDSFNYDTAEELYEGYDFSDLEPFTLIRVDKKGLSAIIHDEEETLLHSFPTDKPHIWSSTTLYKPDIRKAKEDIFAKWLEERPAPSPEEIIDFHLRAGEEKLQNQFIVDYGGVFRTVSLTQIAFKSTSPARLVYKNFVEGSEEVVVSGEL